jgi:hypothetical protein
MFPMIGERAQAIIGVSALAGLGILFPLWLCFASHGFLTILTESSIGQPEVSWPNEMVTDWWWKPIYCFGSFAVWLTAGLLLSLPLMALNVWAGAALWANFVWFGYPVSLMCVMDANNSLAVIHLPLLVRLARHLGAVAAVGLATLPFGIMGAGLLALSLLHSTWWAIPAALVLPWTVFVYARCWGRLAWMLLNLKDRRRPDDEKPPVEAAKATVQDPWAAPAEEPIPEVEVQVEAPPPLAPGEVEDEWAENPRPYGLGSAEETGPTQPAPFSHEEYARDYYKREEARLARAEGRTPREKRRRRKATLGNVLGPDCWGFLLEFRTIRAAVSLGALTLGTLIMLRLALLLLLPMAAG